MASRVMSSWVGPSPPHTSTASDRSSASRSAATMRGRLSPTFCWRRQSMPARASCSPIQAEFVSTICPSSSSVPTATTSQITALRLAGRRNRRWKWGLGPPNHRTFGQLPVVRVARRPSIRYWMPVAIVRATASHSAVSATHSSSSNKRDEGEADGDLLGHRLHLGPARRRDGEPAPRPVRAERLDASAPAR